MIIFLSGSKDAGKTTTARLLEKTLPNTCIVEVDDYYPFLPSSLSLNEKAPYCVELAAKAALELHRKDFTVIIPYPISDGDYNRFKNHLTEVWDAVYFFTLAPQKEKLLNRLKFKDSNFAQWRKAVINEHYKEGEEDYGIVRPKYPSITIDNSDLSPAQTKNKIVAHLREQNLLTE